ncbi:MAG: PEP/pyruvate-binding domain-containing protein [Spirochaetia bacterium]
MIYTIGQISAEKQATCGAKALSLDRLLKLDFPIPPGMAISTELYRRFVEYSGLQTDINIALETKVLDRMRWEEVWDLSRRIRHAFLKTPFPESVQQQLLEQLEPLLDSTLVVRSSSVFEDTRESSFAGLHDSIVNVKGSASLLNAVKEVWSSLWSDRALIYLKELDLRVEDSAMAVVVQKFVEGSVSGVCFTQNPRLSGHILIETVPGLNEGLVSGTVTPDRITVDRQSGRVIEWLEQKRTHETRAAGQGIQRVEISGSGDAVPLSKENVREIAALGYRLEKEFEGAQDVEWTISDGRLYLLQSRPITAPRQDDTPLWQMDDKRAWYRSLHVPYDRLQELKQEIQENYLPALERTALSLAAVDLKTADMQELSEEVQHRKELVEKWKHTYWDLFIPFAHGTRLFGEVYNRVVQPESPFEFIDLLTHEKMQSLRRNSELAQLGKKLEPYPQVRNLEQLPVGIQAEINRFLETYGETSFFDTLLFKDAQQLIQFARRFTNMRGTEEIKNSSQSDKRRQLEERFLSAMTALGRDDGPELLELARTSYRLRDDDNLQVSKIQGEYIRAREELLRRQGMRPGAASSQSTVPHKASYAYGEVEGKGMRVKPRQITGTSASEGMATGRARVVEHAEDLFEVQSGEILICDSIDPTITFVIPLVSAIVERRGGMLVHGAIIAREYGIPCITGIQDATKVFKTGDVLSVDGFLGIVTVLDA